LVETRFHSRDCNMNRLTVPVLLGHVGYLAIASQSSVPLRVGDCVTATTDLEFFFKDEGEYERTHSIDKDQKGVLLNIDSSWVNPSTVEWLKKDTREPEVTGAVFLNQFARVPWWQGRIGKAACAEPNALHQKSHTEQFGLNAQCIDKCMTAATAKDGYQAVVKMADCEKTDADTILNGVAVPQEDLRRKADNRWKQQFSFNDPGCGARPIRSTEDPSKCVDAVHPNKVLLTDCSGVDSQKFLFRCSETPGDDENLVWQKVGPLDTEKWAKVYVGAGPPKPSTSSCQILAMGGRKDMCLWWDESVSNQPSDLVLRPCNYESKKTFTVEKYKLSEQGLAQGLAQYRDRRDDVQAPLVVN